MTINFGYRLEYAFEQPTPMLLMLHAHASYLHALLRPDDMQIDPYTNAQIYHDAFGNTRARVEAAAGTFVISADGWIDEHALDIAPHPFAKEHPLSLLPKEALMYLRPSRHCDVDAHRASAEHWFSGLSSAWSRVQAISTLARRYQEHDAAIPRSLPPGPAERSEPLPKRDTLHFAISLCRALSIPARYCVGYVVAQDTIKPQDFGDWFEVYLGGNWLPFDPWHCGERIFRIAVGHGRDAADVPVCTTFGPSALTSARVWAEVKAMPVQRRAVPSMNNFLDERFGASAA